MQNKDAEQLNKDAEQLFYRAPLDGYFPNINSKFTRSFIRTQTLPEVTPKDNTKILLINKEA